MVIEGYEITMQEQRIDDNKEVKDKILGKNGKILTEEIEDGFFWTATGKEGSNWEFTYIGKQRQSTIDYGMVNVQAEQKIEYFKIEERMESDHLQITL